MHDKTVQDCLLRVTQISGRLALALGSSASSLFKGSEKMSTGLDAKIRVEVASWSSVKFRAGQKWYYRSDTQWPNESEISLKHLEAASTQLPAIFSTPSISQPFPASAVSFSGCLTSQIRNASHLWIPVKSKSCAQSLRLCPSKIYWPTRLWN